MRLSISVTELTASQACRALPAALRNPLISELKAAKLTLGALSVKELKAFVVKTIDTKKLEVEKLARQESSNIGEVQRRKSMTALLVKPFTLIKSELAKTKA